MAGCTIDIDSSIHCEVLVHIKYELQSHNFVHIHSKCRKVHLSLNNVYITTIGASGFENNTAGPEEPYIKDPFAVAATDSAKVKDENNVPCRRRPAFGDFAFVKSSANAILGSGFNCQICTQPSPVSVASKVFQETLVLWGKLDVMTGIVQNQTYRSAATL